MTVRASLDEEVGPHSPTAGLQVTPEEKSVAAAALRSRRSGSEAGQVLPAGVCSIGSSRVSAGRA